MIRRFVVGGGLGGGCEDDNCVVVVVVVSVDVAIAAIVFCSVGWTASVVLEVVVGLVTMPSLVLVAVLCCCCCCCCC